MREFRIVIPAEPAGDFIFDPWCCCSPARPRSSPTHPRRSLPHKSRAVETKSAYTPPVRSPPRSPPPRGECPFFRPRITTDDKSPAFPARRQSPSPLRGSPRRNEATKNYKLPSEKTERSGTAGTGDRGAERGRQGSGAAAAAAVAATAGERRTPRPERHGPEGGSPALPSPCPGDRCGARRGAFQRVGRDPGEGIRRGRRHVCATRA